MTQNMLKWFNIFLCWILTHYLQCSHSESWLSVAWCYLSGKKNVYFGPLSGHFDDQLCFVSCLTTRPTCCKMPYNPLPFMANCIFIRWFWPHNWQQWETGIPWKHTLNMLFLFKCRYIAHLMSCPNQLINTTVKIVSASYLWDHNSLSTPSCAIA